MKHRMNTSGNTRRRLVVAMGATAFTAPIATLAQQPKIWRVGFLGAGLRPAADRPDANIDAFMRGLRELGYVEGRNLHVEWRFAQGRYEQLPALAVDLARSNCDVLVTYGTAGAQALKAATQSIPVVIASAIDPVGMGFAATFARPGGNMTGLSVMAVELSQKQLDLLRDMVPKLARVAVLVNPGNAGHAALLKQVQAGAAIRKYHVVALEARLPEDIETAFARAKREKAGAIIIAGDAQFASLGRQIAAATLKHRLPSIGIYRSHVAEGALMSYGQDIAAFHHRAAAYVGKILKGAKPAELPIEQPMIIELFINGKTAKALGLKIPHSLLISADKVIE